MGRWGTRLFEGDRDLDLLGDLQQMLEPDGVKPEEYYRDDQQQLLIDNRAKFDSGLGDKWMTKLRADESKFDGKYRVILFGALLMCCGAKISDEQLQHLRDIVPDINCHDGYTLPFADEGFRHQGKVQFLAALSHYKPGVPRSFVDLSCSWCGQTKHEIGRAPMRCGRCMMAWYCDKGCQRAHWRNHKRECQDPETRHSLNV